MVKKLKEQVIMFFDSLINKEKTAVLYIAAVNTPVTPSSHGRFNIWTRSIAIAVICAFVPNQASWAFNYNPAIIYGPKAPVEQAAVLISGSVTNLLMQVQNNPASRIDLKIDQKSTLKVEPNTQFSKAKVQDIRRWLADPAVHPLNCGVYALNTILAGKGIKKTPQEVAVMTVTVDLMSGIVKPGDKTLKTSLYAMTRVAQTFDLDYAAAKFRPESLLKVQPPFIAHFKGEHFVTVTGIEGSMVRVMDLGQPLVMSQVAFIEKATGFALVEDLDRYAPDDFKAASDSLQAFVWGDKWQDRRVRLPGLVSNKQGWKYFGITMGIDLLLVGISLIPIPGLGKAAEKAAAPTISQILIKAGIGLGMTYLAPQIANAVAKSYYSACMNNNNIGSAACAERAAILKFTLSTALACAGGAAGESIGKEAFKKAAEETIESATKEVVKASTKEIVAKALKASVKAFVKGAVIGFVKGYAMLELTKWLDEELGHGEGDNALLRSAITSIAGAAIGYGLQMGMEALDGMASNAATDIQANADQRKEQAKARKSGEEPSAKKPKTLEEKIEKGLKLTDEEIAGLSAEQVAQYNNNFIGNGGAFNNRYIFNAADPGATPAWTQQAGIVTMGKGFLSNVFLNNIAGTAASYVMKVIYCYLKTGKLDKNDKDKTNERADAIIEIISSSVTGWSPASDRKTVDGDYETGKEKLLRVVAKALISTALTLALTPADSNANNDDMTAEQQTDIRYNDMLKSAALFLGSAVVDAAFAGIVDQKSQNGKKQKNFAKAFIGEFGENMRDFGGDITGLNGLSSYADSRSAHSAFLKEAPGRVSIYAGMMGLDGTVNKWMSMGGAAFTVSWAVQEGEAEKKMNEANAKLDQPKTREQLQAQRYVDTFDSLQWDMASYVKNTLDASTISNIADTAWSMKELAVDVSAMNKLNNQIRTACFITQDRLDAINKEESADMRNLLLEMSAETAGSRRNDAIRSLTAMDLRTDEGQKKIKELKSMGVDVVYDKNTGAMIDWNGSDDSVSNRQANRAIKIGDRKHKNNKGEVVTLANGETALVIKRGFWGQAGLAVRTKDAEGNPITYVFGNTKETREHEIKEINEYDRLIAEKRSQGIEITPAVENETRTEAHNKAPEASKSGLLGRLQSWTKVLQGKSPDGATDKSAVIPVAEGKSVLSEPAVEKSVMIDEIVVSAQGKKAPLVSITATLTTPRMEDNLVLPSSSKSQDKVVANMVQESPADAFQGFQDIEKGKLVGTQENPLSVPEVAIRAPRKNSSRLPMTDFTPVLAGSSTVKDNAFTALAMTSYTPELQDIDKNSGFAVGPNLLDDPLLLDIPEVKKSEISVTESESLEKAKEKSKEKKDQDKKSTKKEKKEKKDKENKKDTTAAQDQTPFSFADHLKDKNRKEAEAGNAYAGNDEEMVKQEIARNDDQRKSNALLEVALQVSDKKKDKAQGLKIEDDQDRQDAEVLQQKIAGSKEMKKVMRKFGVRSDSRLEFVEKNEKTGYFVYKLLDKFGHELMNVKGQENKKGDLIFSVAGQTVRSNKNVSKQSLSRKFQDVRERIKKVFYQIGNPNQGLGFVLKAWSKKIEARREQKKEIKAFRADVKNLAKHGAQIDKIAAMVHDPRLSMKKGSKFIKYSSQAALGAKGLVLQVKNFFIKGADQGKIVVTPKAKGIITTTEKKNDDQPQQKKLKIGFQVDTSKSAKDKDAIKKAFNDVVVSSPEGTEFYIIGTGNNEPVKIGNADELNEYIENNMGRDSTTDIYGNQVTLINRMQQDDPDARIVIVNPTDGVPSGNAKNTKSSVAGESEAKGRLSDLTEAGVQIIGVNTMGNAEPDILDENAGVMKSAVELKQEHKNDLENIGGQYIDANGDLGSAIEQVTRQIQENIDVPRTQTTITMEDVQLDSEVKVARVTDKVAVTTVPGTGGYTFTVDDNNIPAGFVAKSAEFELEAVTQALSTQAEPFVYKGKKPKVFLDNSESGLGEAREDIVARGRKALLNPPSPTRLDPQKKSRWQILKDLRNDLRGGTKWNSTKKNVKDIIDFKTAKVRLLVGNKRIFNVRQLDKVQPDGATETTEKIVKEMRKAGHKIFSVNDGDTSSDPKEVGKLLNRFTKFISKEGVLDLIVSQPSPAIENLINTLSTASPEEQEREIKKVLTRFVKSLDRPEQEWVGNALKEHTEEMQALAVCIFLNPHGGRMGNNWKVLNHNATSDEMVVSGAKVKGAKVTYENSQTGETTTRFYPVNEFVSFEQTKPLSNSEPASFEDEMKQKMTEMAKEPVIKAAAGSGAIFEMPKANATGAFDTHEDGSLTDLGVKQARMYNQGRDKNGFAVTIEEAKALKIDGIKSISSVAVTSSSSEPLKLAPLKTTAKMAEGLMKGPDEGGTLRVTKSGSSVTTVAAGVKTTFEKNDAERPVLQKIESKTAEKISAALDMPALQSKMVLPVAAKPSMTLQPMKPNPVMETAKFKRQLFTKELKEKVEVKMYRSKKTVSDAVSSIFVPGSCVKTVSLGAAFKDLNKASWFNYYMKKKEPFEFLGMMFVGRTLPVMPDKKIEHEKLSTVLATYAGYKDEVAGILASAMEGLSTDEIIVRAEVMNEVLAAPFGAEGAVDVLNTAWSRYETRSTEVAAAPVQAADMVVKDVSAPVKAIVARYGANAGEYLKKWDLGINDQGQVVYLKAEDAVKNMEPSNARDRAMAVNTGNVPDIFKDKPAAIGTIAGDLKRELDKAAAVPYGTGLTDSQKALHSVDLDLQAQAAAAQQHKQRKSAQESELLNNQAPAVQPLPNNSTLGSGGLPMLPRT